MFVTHNFKKRATKDFVANTTATHQIGIGRYLVFILLHLKGTIAVAGGAANGVAKGLNNALGLIKEVRLEATSKGVYPGGNLVKLSAHGLNALRLFDRSRTVLDATINGAINAAVAVDQLVMIPLSIPRGLKPIETALKTDEYSGLQLFIDLGDEDSILTGNDRNWDYSNLKIDIYDYREALAGDTAVVYLEEKSKNIVAATADFEQSAFGSDGREYLELITKTLSTAADNAVDTVLNNAKIGSQSDDFIDLKASLVRAVNANQVSDAAQALTGHHYFCLASEGDRIPLGGGVMNDPDDPLRVVLDVANPGGAGLDRVLFITRSVKQPKTFKKVGLGGSR